MAGELRLHGFEQRLVQNGFLFPQVNLTPIEDLSDIEAVLENVCEWAHSEARVTSNAAVGQHLPFRANASAVEILRRAFRPIFVRSS